MIKRAFLLCAGLGTRLRPLTNSVPKCLVDINGRPLLDYWLSTLAEAGISEVLINTHHLHETVEQYVRGNYKLKIDLVYEPNLLGTAGSVKRNHVFFNNEPFLLVHADNLSVFDLQDFVRCHDARPQGCAMTMLTFQTATPESCGVLELDSRGVVQKFFEKVPNPPSRLANGAVYILEPEITQFIRSKPGEFIDFSTEVIPNFLGRIYCFNGVKYHIDIGTPVALETARTNIRNFRIPESVRNES